MSVIRITENNFNQEVLKSGVPVLLDFWAPWCAPCRMLSPVVDKVGENLDSRAKVGKINVDEEPGLATQFGIMSIPTLLVIKDGKVVKSSVGVIPEEKIVDMLKAS